MNKTVFLGVLSAFSLCAAGSVASAQTTPLVVIDAGHGGSNTGAKGRKPAGSAVAVFEKQLTMTLARMVAARLAEHGIASHLTRTRDRYLTLHERGRMANSDGATCFVSLHANASPDHSRRGIETYVYESEATDVDAYRATTEAGDDLVRGRLAALEIEGALRDSIRLGRTIQAHLIDTGLSPNRGVRQAGFDVLAGVHAPAVLVEVGFIDHPIEGAALLDPGVQHQIADAIADALVEFVTPHAGKAPQLAAR